MCFGESCYLVHVGSLLYIGSVYAREITFVPRKILLARISSVLCPVSAYSHMVSLLPALPGEPAFGLPSTSGKITPFSKSDIDKMLKDLVIQCGLSPSNYSFHGLRRGGATVASVSGCSDSDICMIGGWASSCYRGYICPPVDSLYRVSQNIGDFCQRCIESLWGRKDGCNGSEFIKFVYSLNDLRSIECTLYM